jgi:glycosyltransferase involved in cell wall biosynthesis
MSSRILIITQKVDRNDDLLGFFHTWLEKFSQQFTQVSVICLEEGTYTLPSNVSVFSLGKERGYSRLRYVLRFYRLIFKLRKEYDFVFVHMNPIYAVLGGLAWQYMKKKVGLWYIHPKVDPSLKKALKLVNIVFSPVKESFPLQTPKLYPIGHGIDTDFFTPYRREAASGSLLMITRISPVKNIDVVIRAAMILEEQHTPFTLDIIASERDQEYKKVLLELSAELQQKGKVTFFEKADVPSTLRAYHSQ